MMLSKSILSILQSKWSDLWRWLSCMFDTQRRVWSARTRILLTAMVSTRSPHHGLWFGQHLSPASNLCTYVVLTKRGRIAYLYLRSHTRCQHWTWRTFVSTSQQQLWPYRFSRQVAATRRKWKTHRTGTLGPSHLQLLRRSPTAWPLTIRGKSVCALTLHGPSCLHHLFCPLGSLELTCTEFWRSAWGSLFRCFWDLGLSQLKLGIWQPTFLSLHHLTLCLWVNNYP